MARRKAPRIPDALPVELRASADPKTAFDTNGLRYGLDRALAEWALNAEMDLGAPTPALRRACIKGSLSLAHGSRKRGNETEKPCCREGAMNRPRGK